MTAVDAERDAWAAAVIADESGVRPFQGIDLTRLSEPTRAPSWLVTGRIARQTLSVIGAKPGVGKSWLVLDLALAVSTGRPWLDSEVPAAARVLYLDAENGDELPLERLQQLEADPAAIGDRLRYVVEPFVFPDPQATARLRATLEEFRPDLVIIDTLASAAPTAERDTEGSSAVLAAVWHPAREAGAAVVLLHHLRKSLQGSGPDDQLDALRGAGHLAGAVSNAWTLAPTNPDEAAFIVHHVKARRGHKQPPIRVRVVDDLDNSRVRTRVQVEGLAPVLESGYDVFLAEVLAHLDASPTHVTTTAALLHMPSAGSERTAKQWLSRAVGSGVLHKPRRGEYARQTTPALPTEET